MEEEEKKEEQEAVSYLDKIKHVVEKELDQFSTNELNEEDLDSLYKLIDINKDIENIDYWNCKKEVLKMRYNEYGDYSDSGYENYGNYGRRGVPGTGRGRYRGHDEGEEMLENMKYSYSAYSDSRNAYNRGNYNAGQDSMEALEDTMRLFTEFAQKMIQEVDSPEAKQVIKKHLRKISQMSGM